MWEKGQVSKENDLFPSIDGGWGFDPTVEDQFRAHYETEEWREWGATPTLERFFFFGCTVRIFFLCVCVECSISLSHSLTLSHSLSDSGTSRSH